MRHIRILCLIGLAAAGLAHTAAAQQQAGPAPEQAAVQYFYGETPITLYVDPAQLGVVFNESADLADPEFASQLDPAIVELRLGSRMSYAVYEPEALAADDASILDKADELLVHNDVAWTSPMLAATPGAEGDMLLQDTFLCSFHPEADPSVMEKMNIEYGVEIVYEKHYKHDRPPRYLLRVAQGGWDDVLAVINAYAQSPLTRYAEPNFFMHNALATTTPNDTYYDDQWHLPFIGADDAWDTTTGDSDVVVAVIDTGVDLDHPDLDDRLWSNTAEVNGTASVDDDNNGYVDDFYGWNWDEENNDPDDEHYHGTACAGVIAAETNNSQGVAGVTWQGKIMALRSHDETGNGDTDDAASAVEYAYENGADILNLSFGADVQSTPLEEAVEDARTQGRDAKGCVIVCAAGNDAANTVDLPARSPYALAVGASDSSKQRLFVSNCGNEVDVIAPGESISTTAIGGYLYDFSNTSSSAPQVSGVAALILAIDSSFTSTEVQAIVQFSAEDLVYIHEWDLRPLYYLWEVAGTGRDIYTGYGLVQADAAVELAQAPRFRITDEDDMHLASFDQQGNFVCEGLLAQECSTLAGQAGELEFRVQNAAGTDLLIVHPDGDVSIRGKLYESTTPQYTYGDCLRIRDGGGNTVAAVNTTQFTNYFIDSDPIPAGSIILGGRAFIGADPDRASSEGT